MTILVIVNYSISYIMKRILEDLNLIKEYIGLTDINNKARYKFIDWHVSELKRRADYILLKSQLDNTSYIEKINDTIKEILELIK